jgi:hypothetical protein
MRVWTCFISRGFFYLVIFVSALNLRCSGNDASDVIIPEWNLTLNVDGGEVRVPLEVFNVYLVEDETFPEVFELLGAGVALVGVFPSDIHVGYGDDWEALFNKSISIKPYGGYYLEPKNSVITLPGKPVMKVLGGFLIAEKVTGKHADLDMTLWGRVNLLVQTPGGERNFEGTFAVYCVTWG